jgi:hypothetical protein
MGCLKIKQTWFCLIIVQNDANVRNKASQIAQGFQ